MPTIPHYIFRSSELFLYDDNTLPGELPAELEESPLDSLELSVGGVPSHAILLPDSATRASVVSSSVSDSVQSASKPETGGRWVRLRNLIAAEDPALASLAPAATRALGLINWHASSRFCARCGSPLSDHPSETARRCPSCGVLFYPRISPAIIVLVEKEGKILLARHAQRNQDVFACLAGFLEHGETLEACVAREVREETGLEVHRIRYAGSQSWPFPDQFMVAFRAEWKSGEIRVDPSEILEARWFDRNDLPATPQRGTVAWRLIYDQIHPDFGD